MPIVFTRYALVLCTMLTFTGCSQLRDRSGRQALHSIADPNFLDLYAATGRFRLGSPSSIRFVPGTDKVLFLRGGATDNEQDLYEYDISTGKERVLLTADQILQGGQEQLTPEELARRERMRMAARGIANYDLSDDGTEILVPLSGRLFVVERESGNVREVTDEGGTPIDPRFSPDGTMIACVREGDLYVIDLATAKQRRLTTGATEHVKHGLAEFVAQEEMGRRQGYWWSPDSRHIAYERYDTSSLETFYIADPSDPAKEPQSWPYPRAGKSNAVVELGIVSVDGGEATWINWDRAAYPYLATVKWSENAPLTILVQNRTQTEEVLYAVDARHGNLGELLREQDDAWINLDQSMPHWLPDGQRFLWTTERNGAWQVELRARSGRLIGDVTPLDFGFKGFEATDEDRGLVYVQGSDDPTQTHLFSFPLTTPPGDPVTLTHEPGIHSATFAKDCRLYLHTASLMDGSSMHEIRKASGQVVGTIKSAMQEPPFIPNIELTTVGRNPSFHCVLVRPRNFNPSRAYPVIVSVYGGPHAQTVIASPRRYLLQQWMADHGFIVVSIDGRGTPSRGRAWERKIKGNLIDKPLADQVRALKLLGRRYDELDLSRVGVFGWSFGGYFTAMAVAREPEMFDVGVAGAPVVDWADYDTHYTERYMGLPAENTAGYEASNVLTYADGVTRPLLLIHGTADDNVYLVHTLKLTAVLNEAGAAYDFLPLPGQTHSPRGAPILKKVYGTTMDYFTKHLPHE